jgi:hypothetical protein
MRPHWGPGRLTRPTGVTGRGEAFFRRPAAPPSLTDDMICALPPSVLSAVSHSHSHIWLHSSCQCPSRCCFPASQRPATIAGPWAESIRCTRSFRLRWMAHGGGDADCESEAHCVLPSTTWWESHCHDPPPDAFASGRALTYAHLLEDAAKGDASPLDLPPWSRHDAPGWSFRPFSRLGPGRAPREHACHVPRRWQPQ